MIHNPTIKKPDNLTNRQSKFWDVAMAIEECRQKVEAIFTGDEYIVFCGNTTAILERTATALQLNGDVRDIMTIDTTPKPTTQPEPAKHDEPDYDLGAVNAHADMFLQSLNNISNKDAIERYGDMAIRAAACKVGLQWTATEPATISSREITIIRKHIASVSTNKNVFEQAIQQAQ